MNTSAVAWDDTAGVSMGSRKQGAPERTNTGWWQIRAGVGLYGEIQPGGNPEGLHHVHGVLVKQFSEPEILFSTCCMGGTMCHWLSAEIPRFQKLFLTL